MFFHPSDATRNHVTAQEWLMSTSPEMALDRCTRAAHRLLRVPVTMLNVTGRGRWLMKSVCTTSKDWPSKGGTWLNNPICEYVRQRGEALFFNDVAEQVTLRDHEFVRNQLVKAYAGVPVFDARGETLGVLCAVDTKPHRWTKLDLEVLELLAGIVAQEANAKEQRARGKTVAQSLS